MNMKKQYKDNDGIEGKSRKEVANKTRANCTDLVVRFLAMALTLTAAVVLATDKQETTVRLKLASALPPVDMPVTAKWFYLSSLVYFVVANAIAFAHAAGSLVLTLATKGVKKSLSLTVMILDLLMVVLLFSAVGASGAVGLIGYQGNSHVKWDKMCNVFGKFCNQGASAIVLSFLGSIAYVLLVLLAVMKLHRDF